MRSGSHANQKLATFGNTENVAKRCQDETGRESSPVKDWRDGRAVYCTGLENRRSVRIRGFESHSLRHSNQKAKEARWPTMNAPVRLWDAASGKLIAPLGDPQ